MATPGLAAALRRIARAVSGTLELGEVFAEVAQATSEVLPFEWMGVAKAEGADGQTLSFRSYSAVTGEQTDAVAAMRLADFSPGFRPSQRGVTRFDDVTRVLDPNFALDRKLLESGKRSFLYATLWRGEKLAGFVSVTSSRPSAFTAADEEPLASIADLVGVALEHERLSRLDAERRRRLDVVDALLPMMANVLDVREIFTQVSDVVKPVLPHDKLVLKSFNADRTEISIDAVSGEPIPALPTRYRVEEGCPVPLHEDEIIEDVEAYAGAFSREGRERCAAEGLHALLVIRLRLEGGVIGALAFGSRNPGQYGEDDLVVGRRVADHVSLALSHQRLAEEGRRAAEARERAARLEERVEALKEELATTKGYARVVGVSKSWNEALTHAARVAPTETTVLLTGESGTGKEVVARLIHRGSPRANGPFVALNCTALPDTLLESELFGHERGAFTGAVGSHAGRIEQASGGVLFLDEIGEMSLTVQAKVLRVLQEREFQRLGGTRAVRANVRFVAATNRDLAAAIARGQFREDLYYRLNVFEIALAPLRERPEDILPLADWFLSEVGPSVGRPAAGISREAKDAMLRYSWPGNARELRNVLERATILCDGGLITLEHLPVEVGSRKARAGAERLDTQSFPPGGVDLEV
ncbi:MAG TPA: sigma 54-interacting transcriptional regulator, partial [Thermoanaerobaculia bacterium]|nr:sigma 54-interacting transcriptional regulator [Thermoanaerobaculia bacterium]